MGTSFERERRPVGEDVGGEPDRLGKLESENDSNAPALTLSPSHLATVERLCVELRDIINDGGWKPAPASVGEVAR